jgi:diphthamide biosynthesis enzyme Dph1/Dph2 domain
MSSKEQDNTIELDQAQQRSSGTANSNSERPRRRRIIRKRTNRAGGNTIPSSIADNQALISAIATSLPIDYEFEILKTIWRIETSKAKHVALQMPEGLLMYACTIADILRNFSVAETISILGDVTYGACCIDDLGAKALGADLLVHYGHSCLVPLTTTSVPCLYVFVEIRVDVDHLVECFCKTCPAGTRVHVMGTVQVSNVYCVLLHFVVMFIEFQVGICDPNILFFCFFFWGSFAQPLLQPQRP